MIPKILHRCAFGSVPAKFDGFWREWADMHPDWQLFSWEAPLDPDEWRLGYQFAKAGSFSQLADMVSAEVVWRHGGVYVDWDTQCLKPLDELLTLHDCWFGSEAEPWVSHGIFAATPEHPALDAIVDAMGNVDFSLEPNESTGPGLLTRVLKNHPQVMIPPKEWFYPVDPGEEYGWWQNASGRQIAEAFPDAYTIHHWAHSWKNHREGRMSIYNTETLQDILTKPSGID